MYGTIVRRHSTLPGVLTVDDVTEGSRIIAWTVGNPQSARHIEILSAANPDSEGKLMMSIRLGGGGSRIVPTDSIGLTSNREGVWLAIAVARPPLYGKSGKGTPRLVSPMVIAIEYEYALFPVEVQELIALFMSSFSRKTMGTILSGVNPQSRLYLLANSEHIPDEKGKRASAWLRNRLRAFIDNADPSHIDQALGYIGQLRRLH